MIWMQAWTKMWGDVGVLSIILGFIVFAITEGYTLYTQSPNHWNSAVWSNIVIPIVISLGVWAVIIFGMMIYYTSKQSVFVYNNKLRKINDFEETLGPPRIVKIDVKEANSYSDRVGVNIFNNDNDELTDIYINLTSLKQFEEDEKGIEHATGEISLSDDNRRIYFSDETSKVGVGDRTAFYLANVKDKEFGFLLEKRFALQPARRMGNRYMFAKRSGNNEVCRLKWEFLFEIHGKIEGKSFRKETYSGEIRETRSRLYSNSDRTGDPEMSANLLEIGKIRHIENRVNN